MRSIIIALALVAGMLAAIAGPALGSQPPGQRGYEGQPGNQGGSHHAPGLLGYEGQPAFDPVPSL